MTGTNISVERKKLSEVLRAIDDRRFAIPKLQREFVWDGPKAAKLFDSIVRGMPIGTVTIWHAPRSERLHLRQAYHVLPQFDVRHPKVWFLLDGQQRVSVLHLVRQGTTVQNARRRDIEFSRVVLALNVEGAEEIIRYRKPVDGEFVSLSDLLSTNWRQRLAGLPARKFARAARARRAILDYRLFLTFLRSSIGDVREAFLRINTQGMKITTADAIFSRAEDLKLRDVYHEVRDGLDEAFRGIEEAPILFAMLAVRGGREARGEALGRELNRLEVEVAADPSLRKKLEKTWRDLREAFGKAVDYLRQTFKIVHLSFLYSDYMIAILALFYYHNGGRGPGAFQRVQIKRWFWATTVGSRYSGRNFNRYIRRDVEYFEQLVSDQTKPFRYRPEWDRSELRRAQYTSQSGMASAFYSLLFLRRPVSIMDDGLNEIPIERYAAIANRKDRHHIFPAGLMSNKDIPPKDFNSVANICLLTAQENQRIGRRHPRSYLSAVRTHEKTFKAKMGRHFLPIDETSGVWQLDIPKGFRAFLHERTDMLCDAMEETAGLRLFRREELPR